MEANYSALLNFSYVLLLNDSKEMLRPVQKAFLTSLNERIRLAPASNKAYLESSTPILLNCLSSKRVAASITCGYAGLRCGNRKFCEKCCVARTYKKLKPIEKLLKSEAGRYVYMLTISPNKCVFPTLDEANENIHSFWNIPTAFIVNKLKNKILLGAVLTEELKVMSFVTKTVIPHIHGIIASDIPLVEHDALDALGRPIVISDMQPDGPFSINLIPVSKEDVWYKLKYCIKPIELSYPYRTDCYTHGEVKTNLAVTPFVNRLVDEITVKRRALRTLGAYHHRSVHQR